MAVRIAPSRVEGRVALPSSKSHSIRAVFFAGLARGESHLKGLLDSPDVEAAMAAAQAFGAHFHGNGRVSGVAGNPRLVSGRIDAGNSGLVLRFYTALAGLMKDPVLLDGDNSLQSLRPLAPLLGAMESLGAKFECLGHSGKAPVRVQGPLSAGHCSLRGRDSQPVSALLMVAPFLEGDTHIQVLEPGERPWIDLTLSWLKRLGVDVAREGYDRYTVHGPQVFEGFEYEVPGDFSSAAFPVAAALVGGSSLKVGPLDPEDPQGDKALFEGLSRVGAQISWDGADLSVRSSRLGSWTVDANAFIDAVPILSVLGCYASGPWEIRNVAMAREKECNRLAVMVAELRKMGARIWELEDGIRVEPSSLKGAVVNSHADHRVAMALTVAAMGAEGNTEIQGEECVKKTFPGFFEVMSRAGLEVLP